MRSMGIAHVKKARDCHALLHEFMRNCKLEVVADCNTLQ